MQKAAEVEADAVKLLPGVRASKYVKRRIEQAYGECDRQIKDHLR
jgi:hypothetical protein